MLQSSPIGLSAASGILFHQPTKGEGEGDDQDNIEDVATRFLGCGTPFYQFYTDFVALYDAISFAHPLFASLLLPLTSQRYAPDYRKLLFSDTAHVLGTVRTPIEQVVGRNVGEFLWPLEEDAEVLGAYLGVLVGKRGRGKVEGFVRMLVVHHIAGNVWPDLRDGDDGVAVAGGAEERARKLLEAVVMQGRMEDVKDTVCYWQVKEGNVVLPDGCFELSVERKKTRLEWVQGWASDRILERIRVLLES